MNEQQKQEFKIEMEMDAKEEAWNERQNARLDYRLSTDYEFLMETYADEFKEATAALKVLKLIHKKHEQTWNISEIGDLV